MANLGTCSGIFELHFMENRLNGVVQASLDTRLPLSPFMGYPKCIFLHTLRV